jgi:hypothetical protein
VLPGMVLEDEMCLVRLLPCMAWWLAGDGGVAVSGGAKRVLRWLVRSGERKASCLINEACRGKGHGEHVGRWESGAWDGRSGVRWQLYSTGDQS